MDTAQISAQIADSKVVQFAFSHPLLVALIAIWVIIWKGLALWKAAQLRQSYWFIAILLINTLGILEIVYIFLVARKYKVEVVEN